MLDMALEGFLLVLNVYFFLNHLRTSFIKAPLPASSHTPEFNSSKNLKIDPELLSEESQKLDGDRETLLATCFLFKNIPIPFCAIDIVAFLLVLFIIPTNVVYSTSSWCLATIAAILFTLSRDPRPLSRTLSKIQNCITLPPFSL